MPGGRPTSFTQPLAKKIAAMIAEGHTRDHAALSNSLDPKTLLNWYRRGKNGEEPFVEFFRLLRAADAQWESDLLVTLQKCERGMGNIIWMLERDRRTRARWGPRSRFDDADRSAVHDLADVSDADLEAAERLLRGKKSA
jgi:hypothetical protein